MPGQINVVVFPNDEHIAAGHVEDHPLERRDGSFAYIDSFVRIERLKADGSLERLAELNVSEHGLVTPKALAFVDDTRVAVAAAGSPALGMIDISSLS